MPEHRRRFAPVWGVGAALIGVLLPVGPSASAQQATFKSKVDLIAVDVQVIDADGRPITSLGQNDFEVSIDGRRRRVVALEQIAFGGGDAAATRPKPAGVAPRATNLWPSETTEGRTFIIAIDASSFDAGAALPVRQAARDFVDRLAASDKVGVFTLPSIGPRIDPTEDRVRIRQALEGVTGQRRAHSGQFNLSVAEIIDIVAENGLASSPTMSNPGSTSNTQRAGTSSPISVAPDTVDVLQRVQARECRRPGDMGCLQGIVGEAASLAQQFEERASQTLNGINELLQALPRYPGRKTVVVISGGMPVSDRPGGRVNIGAESTRLGEQAARANATIYAIHVDASVSEAYSASSRRARSSATMERERVLAGKLLDQFSAASGGELFTSVVGAGEAALDRVLRETSAFYLLGVEPGEGDRDGRTHRLRVRVSTRGATVRSREWVLLR